MLARSLLSAAYPSSFLRRLFLGMAVLLAFVTVAAHGQTAPANKTWANVQALAANTNLRVYSTVGGHVDCRFVSATEDSLNCGGATFQRANIKQIKKSHRVRSTFVGLGIGYLGAAGVSAIAARTCNTIGCAAAIGFVDLVLIVVAPIVGHITDFTANTIYKAP